MIDLGELAISHPFFSLHNLAHRGANFSSAMMALPKAIPDNFSIAWPLSFFATKIPRLRSPAQEEYLTEDDGVRGVVGWAAKPSVPTVYLI